MTTVEVLEALNGVASDQDTQLDGLADSINDQLVTISDNTDSILDHDARIYAEEDDTASRACITYTQCS
jgi:hypothetical protein